MIYLQYFSSWIMLQCYKIWTRLLDNSRKIWICLCIVWVLCLTNSLCLDVVQLHRWLHEVGMNYSPAFWDISYYYSSSSWMNNSNVWYISLIISVREKLAVCDVKNLPCMDINWQSIAIYGYIVTSLTAYYSCADINRGLL